MCRNQLVPTKSRSKDAIRQEIVESAINYLNTRLDETQDGLLREIRTLLESSTCGSFIASGRSTQRIEHAGDNIRGYVLSVSLSMYCTVLQARFWLNNFFLRMWENLRMMYVKHGNPFNPF